MKQSNSHTDKHLNSDRNIWLLMNLKVSNVLMQVRLLNHLDNRHSLDIDCMMFNLRWDYTSWVHIIHIYRSWLRDNLFIHIALFHPSNSTSSQMKWGHIVRSTHSFKALSSHLDRNIRIRFTNNSNFGDDRSILSSHQSLSRYWDWQVSWLDQSWSGTINIHLLSIIVKYIKDQLAIDLSTTGDSCDWRRIQDDWMGIWS